MTDYDQVAAHYETRYRNTQYPGLTRALNALVLPGVRALEVGAGTGHWLRLLASQQVRALGLEPSREMIARARAADASVPLVRGSASALPFSSGAFELVYCVNALHHFPEPRRFLAEARRCLRNDGRLAIMGMDPHVGVDSWCIYDYFDGTRELDRARFVAAPTLRAWLAEAGFRAAQTEVAEHLDLTLDAASALAGGRLDKRSTSQLSELDDESYRRGIERIELAAAADPALQLRIDVRLYATVAHV